MDLKSKIREIPDWPEKGVNFKDITPLLQDKEAFSSAIDKMAEPFDNAQGKPDIIVGIDARGFILSAAMAYKLKTGLAIIRKKGKLPHKTICQEYKLEYATNTIEMHEDAIEKGQKVLLVDDVLATGGTMEATCQIVEKLGGQILGISFLIELDFLKGREKLKNYKVNSLVHY
ncbi:MAG: adenine phosphoribosyltransferase [Candidatus Portnoybacteria bacterium RBG_13_40_8]|uniref:Adenine phosphoribosyltransferase n=1 Tax=Candidatus Portnoybacteria bacterium RBG_13_40_8 TaxID=1801990 RepID=A0A1G2F3M8_9BACT|nr:MAG: adenine phosphoribosyltransferase [Candidatus Portnoybacteria bacterium RBG_13_40_8]